MALGVIYPIMYNYSSITIPFLLVTSHFCWLQSRYDTIVNAIIIALPNANNSTPAIILLLHIENGHRNSEFSH